MTPLDPRIADLQRRFRTDTPWWAGGVVREADGTWRFPDTSDPDAFVGVAKILDKSRASVPAIARPWQLEFDEVMERQRSEGKPIRVIILKARQLGFSTWVALKFLQRLTQFPYQRGMIVAQDVKTASIIFEMAKHAYAHLPSELELGLGFSIKPALIGAVFSPNGQKFMLFGEPSRQLRMEGRTEESMLEIDTAGAPESGRGGTRNMLHLSEVARWPDGAATGKMLSQLNAVPELPDTVVVMESTANGMNHYYRRWQSAVAGSEDPDTGETYVPLFVPWWRDPAASMPFVSDEARARFEASIGDTRAYGEVAEDEEAIRELYSLSAEQLQWRRMMVRTKHESSVQLFKQENPASPDEAFIGSGRTVFAGILISKAIKATEEAPAPVQGTLRVTGTVSKRTRKGTVDVPVEVAWVASGEMRPGEHVLEVWEHPRGEPEAVELEDRLPAPTAASSPELLEAARAAAEEGAETEAELGPGIYVVACDVAEGLVNTVTEGDFTVVQVFDHETGMQVATHVSRLDYNELPGWLYAIGLYYNVALLAPESNAVGQSIVDVLDKEMRYPNLYRRKKVDKAMEVAEKKMGWRTDKVTKGLLEQTWYESLADGTHGLRDPITAREMQTYVRDERGRTGAQYGEHDDRLMSAMIGKRVVVTERPRRRGAGGRGPRPADDPVTGFREFD